MDLNRYSVIKEKNKREIVLLRGNGCKWRKCRFCDYHLDFCLDDNKNFELNKKILGNVKGLYNSLEVINSGSFVDLDKKTIELIKNICLEKNITTLHFECHWLHKDKIQDFKDYFKKDNITIKIKSGIETFDYKLRESEFIKGIPNISAIELSKYFDEVCLLFGVTGQTEESMQKDIEIGLKYFERICINIMVENNTPVKPDFEVIKTFKDKLYKKYISYENVDILMENTDFGVG